MPWSPFHVHSQYSSTDALSRVSALVQRAAEFNFPAMGLTDHGNMAGATTLYKSCMKEGIQPFPGVEAYIIDPSFLGDLESKEGKAAKRYHLTFLALNYNGYQHLVQAVSLSHTRPRFHRYPRLTMADLADLSAVAGNDIAVLTGCFFGLVQQHLALVNPNVHDNTALSLVQTLAGLFPHTFVEVQNHKIDQPGASGDIVRETDIVRHLIEMADTAGLPIIATQDSHYLEPEEQAAHDLMKKCVYNSTDDAFPGDSYHFASERWVKKHYLPRQWSKIVEGADHLTSLSTLRIPALDTFKAHVPSSSTFPQSALRIQTHRALKKRAESDPRFHRREYKQRLRDELRVIGHLKMANYFLLVRQYVEWCERKHILIEARGSANASLVCFLLGITQVDPIRYNLIFERFLSKDRTKPPDIDMDVEDIHQDALLEYLFQTYGAYRIGSWSSLGANEEDTGSALVTYKAWLARQQTTKEDRDAVYSGIQTVEDVKKVSRSDYTALDALVHTNPYKGPAVHAGGVLLPGDDLPLGPNIPQMRIASSDRMVTQYDMDALDEWGLLKLDILSQKTLTIMRRTQELMGRSNPADFSWIPDNDPETFKHLRDGRTDTGIFHFEGYTKAKGGHEMKTRSIRDVILVHALYMPGAMNSGETAKYITRRFDRESRDNITYLHPIFERHLKDTHGAVVFQEQVMMIFRDLGMSIEKVNVLLKMLKDSGAGSQQRNASRMAQLRGEFDQLCKKHGIDADAAWSQTTGFAAYGFNRAHATGYGIRSYRCAYLKAHYPLEFMAAVLESNAGGKKERIYVREARHMGIRVLPAHVNTSGTNWSIDRTRKNVIRRPLVSIKGVGWKAAEDIVAHQPFTDVDDIIARTNPRHVTGGKSWAKEGTLNGVLATLDAADALEGLMP